MLGLNRTKIWKNLTFIIPYTLLNSMHTHLCGTIKSLINQTSNILCVCTRMLSHSVVSLCNPMNCSPQGFSVRGILQARILEWVAYPSSGVLPNSGIEPRSPTLQVDSLPCEPPGKPKNTGEGSLSLLQGDFLTQESNQGLLHCRQILYQLSYPGN